MLTYTALIFLTVQRYGKGSIYPNTIGIFFGGNFIMYSFYDDKNKTISRVLLFGAGFLD